MQEGTNSTRKKISKLVPIVQNNNNNDVVVVIV